MLISRLLCAKHCAKCLILILIIILILTTFLEGRPFCHSHFRDDTLRRDVMPRAAQCGLWESQVP